MDFRKKNSGENAQSNSRFGGLKSDSDDSNPFQTVQKRGRRRRENEQSARKRENLPGTMPLPGIEIEEQKSGKYVAPNQRKKLTENKGLNIKREQKPKKKEAPVLSNEVAFPSLGEGITLNEESDVPEGESFAAKAATVDPIVKPKIIDYDIEPGWVRLRRGKNGELIKEYGPEVPKSQFWIDWERAEEERKRRDLIETLERNMAYVRWAYPYETWWESEDDDYENSDYDGFEDVWVEDSN